MKRYVLLFTLLVLTYMPLPGAGEGPLQVEGGEGWIEVDTGSVAVLIRESGSVVLSLPGEERSIMLTFSGLYAGDAELGIGAGASLGADPWQLQVVRQDGEVEVVMKKSVELTDMTVGHGPGMGGRGGMGMNGGSEGRADLEIHIRVFTEPKVFGEEEVGGPEEVKIDIVLAPAGVEAERIYLEQRLGEEGLNGEEGHFRWAMVKGTVGRGARCNMGGEARELFMCSPSSGVGSVAYRAGGGEELGAYTWTDRVIVNTTGGESGELSVESYIGEEADVVVFSYPAGNVTEILHDPVFRLSPEAVKRALEVLHREFLEHIRSILLGTAAGVALVVCIAAYVGRRVREEDPLSNPYLREPPRR